MEPRLLRPLLTGAPAPVGSALAGLSSKEESGAGGAPCNEPLEADASAAAARFLHCWLRARTAKYLISRASPNLSWLRRNLRKAEGKKAAVEKSASRVMK